MKTKGMKHQLEYLRASEGRDYFAMFAEQGTGKTWALLADAERAYAAGKIDGLFVLAPNGVHTNWVLREIPEHLDARFIARAWRSGANKRQMARLEELFSVRQVGEIVPLRILTMNIDAINFDAGFKFAVRFLRATKSMIVVDESTRIKNPKAGRSERACVLRQMAVMARIGSGRPNPQSPLDFFGQFEFLRSGLLGTSSYRAFVAEHAHLESMDSKLMKNMVAKNPRAAFAQVIAKDPLTGAPLYKNLDRLEAAIRPHAFRVLKKDCLDLPDKIYQQVYFDLAPKQRAAYTLMNEERRIILDGRASSVKKLAALTKLQQITSGFILINGEVHRPPQLDENPRLKALMELIEDDDAPMIIWARFREEIDVISRALKAAGRRAVEYHGGIGKDQRERAVDEFQAGAADTFLGTPGAGGIGLTLTRAEWTVYYSNDFNLETRTQSEDRNHRKGTTKSVRYVDLIARSTIDEAITRTLQRKDRLSATLLGDRGMLRAFHGVEEGEAAASGIDFVNSDSIELMDAMLAAGFSAADAAAQVQETFARLGAKSMRVGSRKYNTPSTMPAGDNPEPAKATKALKKGKK